MSPTISAKQHRGFREAAARTPVFGQSESAVSEVALLQLKKTDIASYIETSGSCEMPNGILISSGPGREKGKFLLNVLKQHCMLKVLDEGELMSLVGAMKEFHIGPREALLTQGDVGHQFFVLESGKLEVVIDNIRQNTLDPGSSFGDFALVYDELRAASVKTVARSVIWTVDRATFLKGIVAAKNKYYEQNRKFVESTSLFDGLRIEEKLFLLEIGQFSVWGEGERIIRGGDVGSVVFVIVKGEVTCSVKGKEIRKFATGEMFGEQAVLLSGLRTADVLAVKRTEVISMHRKYLETCFGEQYANLMYRTSILFALEKQENLKKLTNSQLLSIAESMKLRSFRSGEVIVTQGTPREAYLYIILKGEIQ